MDYSPFIVQIHWHVPDIILRAFLVTASDAEEVVVNVGSAA